MKTEDLIQYGILAFIWVKFLWELNLSLRQHHIYRYSVTVPSYLKDIISESTYEKARLYSLDKSKFRMVIGIISLLITTVIILIDGLLFFWIEARSVVKFMGFEENEYIQSVAFIFLISTINLVTSLPISIYYNFVLKESHGFNKQTIVFYIKDTVRSYIFCELLAVSLICGMIYIVKLGGDYFVVYLWLLAMSISLFLLIIYPDYIAPLLDKYTPLPDGELKTRIEKLAASVNFPLYKMYIVEGSKRSVHSNAYLVGFFKSKRIVLFDTLLKDYSPPKNSKDEKENIPEEKKGCDNEEILAVLAHELGHWKLNHEIKNLIIKQVELLLRFIALSLLFNYKELYRAFGFYNEQPIFIGIFIFAMYIFSPYDAVLSFGMNVLKRKFEFEADDFAKSLGMASYLRRALIKINQDNLKFPVYDWLYSMWHYSHPPLLERLQYLDKLE